MNKTKIKIVGFLIICISMFLFCGCKPKTMKIVGMSWENEQKIETYMTVKEKGWSVPEGGRIYKKRREVRSTTRMIDYIDSNGTAHYKTIENYDTRYYYEIEKWVVTDSHIDSGNDKNPYVSEVTLGENQRLGEVVKRRTVRAFIGTRDDKTNTYHIEDDLWSTLDVGKEYYVDVIFYNIISATPIE